MTTSRTCAALVIALSAATFASAVGAGCGSPDNSLSLSTSVTSGAGTGTGGAQAQAGAAKALFDALKTQLVKECGACHKVGGSADTPFLGDPETGSPDTYKTITSWPQFVIKDYAKSRLLLHPDSKEHKGVPSSEELKAKLTVWLAEEAKSVKDVSMEVKPTIPPFKPIVPGFNAVYLGALGVEFEGMAVTFSADELTPTTLSLTQIQVHPTTKKGLKLVHPLFTVFPAGSMEGDPDPVDSFSNVMLELQPGAVGNLGPGKVILTNWQGGAKLSLAFESVSAIDPNAGTGGAGGGTVSGGCKAVDSFKLNAQQMLNTCFGCHGGSNDSATNAVDMKALMSDPAKACGQVKNRVDVITPAKSQLFVTTNPGGNATHPYKFGGNTTQFNNFVNSVSKWITAEK
jgi:hypothetical protein